MKQYSDHIRNKLLDLGFPRVLADECVDLTLTGMWEHSAPDDLLDRIFQSLRLSMEKAAEEEGGL